MRRSMIAIAAALLMTAGIPAATAGPTQGGYASDNVEFVAHVPFEVGTATGAKVVGKYLYVTSWKTFSIYDVSDPTAPQLITTEPFGIKFENEDVATNGEILLFSEQLPQNILHVWDVEDKSNPTEIATLAGGGGHTSDCILNCTYSYSSTGVIVDLRKPTAPKIVGNWGKGMPATSAHDVNEVAPGRVLTSSNPIILLDGRKNPAKPKLVAVGQDKRVTGGIHSNQWPNTGEDDIVLFSSESNFTGRCSGANGAFMTWDGSDWKKTGTLRMLDIYQLNNGTYSDGQPAVNAMGCSAHWFEEHPTFDNGGLVVMGSYDHGTRFIDVSSKGKIKEVGYFIPYGGETSAAYWMTKDLVYSVDYTRGIDILKYNGKP
ncbi:MAG: LVIVD repeat-containing protein [Actinomycetota bacterium]